MDAAKTRAGNRYIQASWANRGWSQTSMAYLALLCDPEVMRTLKLQGSSVHESRNSQNETAKQLYDMVLTAINVRETSMSIHSETAPDQWNGILDQDYFLSEESHKKMQTHANIISRARLLAADPEFPDSKVTAELLALCLLSPLECFL